MSEIDTEASSQENTVVPSLLLAHLRCPTTGLELKPMNTPSLIALNGRVTMHQAYTIEGKLVERSGNARIARRSLSMQMLQQRGLTPT